MKAPAPLTEYDPCPDCTHKLMFHSRLGGTCSCWVRVSVDNWHDSHYCLCTRARPADSR